MANWFCKINCAWILGLSGAYACPTLDHWRSHPAFEVQGLAYSGPQLSMPDSADFGIFRMYWSANDKAWDSSSKDAQGRPLWVIRIGTLLQSVQQRYMGMGFHMPPLRGGQYPVYVHDIGKNAFALTQQDFGYGDHPLTPEKEKSSWSSFMELPSDPSYWNVRDTLGVLKVTLAHEFFHALQLGYSSDLIQGGVWLMEAEATAMENFFFPEVGDNRRYVNAWLQNPQAPLDFDSFSDCKVRPCVEAGHEYGLWPVFDAWNRLDSTALLKRNQLGVVLGTNIFAQLDSVAQGLGQGSFRGFYPKLWAEALDRAKYSQWMDVALWSDSAVQPMVVTKEWGPKACGDTLWGAESLSGHAVDLVRMKENLPQCKYFFNSGTLELGLSVQGAYKPASDLNGQSPDQLWSGAYLIAYADTVKAVRIKNWYVRTEGRFLDYIQGQWLAAMDMDMQIYNAKGTI